MIQHNNFVECFALDIMAAAAAAVVAAAAAAAAGDVQKRWKQQNV